MPAIAKAKFETVMRTVLINFLHENIIFSSEKKLTVTQLYSLAFIDYYQEININELSSYMYLSISATSRLVDTLVKKKLVVRTHCLKDHRAKILVLTDLGKTYVETLHESRRAIWTNYITKNMSREDLSRLTVHLMKGS